MSTTKPDSETGWSKEWPKVTGYYWRRINDHDYPSLVRIVGDTCRFSDGSSEGRYECYEFVGPLSPSDFEQLLRLRKVAALTLKVLDDADYGLDVYSLAPNLRSAAKALREALTHTGEQS